MILLKSNQIDFLKKEIKYKMIILICVSLILISLVLYYFEYLLDPILSIIPISIIFLISFTTIMTLIFILKFSAISNFEKDHKDSVNKFILSIHLYKMFYDKTELKSDIDITKSEDCNKVFIFDLNKIKNLNEIIDKNEIQIISKKLLSSGENSYSLEDDL